VSFRTRLAVTLGDPRGIGPEVAAAAARRALELLDDLQLVFVGPAALIPEGLESEPVTPPQGSEGAGTVAGASIEIAVEMALSGRVHGIVTGPIHKPSLHAAGYPFPGHTEMLRHLCNVPEVGMLMAAERTRIGGPLRVLLATTHIPLRDVPTTITPELIRSQTRLLDRALTSQWGIAKPRVALCAINPHASDDGLFGDEEDRILRPALEALAQDGISVSGPIPADTVFTRTLNGEFDGVVAPYHDVGMAGFKTASFGTGVNVTLGLPFVRTSPDHGTAFDLVGTGTADPASMTEALLLAARLARTGFDMEGTQR
jgi:4-hydroxythreonine-4-phosphate dehydrogenase